MYEMLLQVAIYVAKLRESSPRNHKYRLQCAKKVLDLVNEFIAKEVRAAVEENQRDPAHLSWHEVGECLNLSKTAAYTRYGTKQTNGSK